MIYSNETKEYWAEKYKIDLTPIKCNNCKNEVNLSKPFAIKAYRCIEFENCKNCGEKHGFRCIPVNDKLEFWESFRPNE